MSLKQAALSAGRWTAASTAISFLLQIAQVMVLARLLAPADFGVMAVAAALIAIVALVADFGLSRALVHFDLPSREALATLYWLNLGLGVALGLAFIALAPLLGALYQSPALVPVLQLAALVFPLTALGQQFRVLAEKELRFDRVARCEMAAAVAGFVVAVASARAGAGVFALVAGALATAAANSLLAWLLLSAGRRPLLAWRPAEIAGHLRYGRYMVGENFANVLNRQADVFVGGLLLGPRAMGLFAVPRDLCLRTGMIINQVMTRVGFPVMAQVKDDPARLQGIYLRTLRMTASVNFPVFVAMALFAEEIVAVLYGAQWHGAATFLRVLALWGLVRSVGQPIGSLLYAVGMARRALAWNLAQLLVFPPAYAIAIQAGGLPALALAMLGLQLVIFLPAWFWLVRPACGATLADFLVQPALPLALALAAGAAAWLATLGFDGALLRLALGGAIGGAAYAGLSYAFNRDWALTLLGVAGLRPRGA